MKARIDALWRSEIVIFSIWTPTANRGQYENFLRKSSE